MLSMTCGALLRCAQAVRAFKLAGLVDDKGVWSGGDTVCVQVRFTRCMGPARLECSGPGRPVGCMQLTKVAPAAATQAASHL